MSEWDKIERKLLRKQLDPNRKPNDDPFHELLMGLGYLRSNLQMVVGRPVVRMDVHPSAWRVILKSPVILQTGRLVPAPALSDSSCTTIMGVRVVVDDRLPDGVVAFLDSTGECVRMIFLVDTPLVE